MQTTDALSPTAGASLTQPLGLTRLLRVRRFLGFDAVPFLDVAVLVAVTAFAASQSAFAPGWAIQLPGPAAVGVGAVQPPVILTVAGRDLFFVEGQAVTRARLLGALEAALPAGGATGIPILLQVPEGYASEALFGLIELLSQAGYAEVILAAEPALPQDTLPAQAPLTPLGL